MGLGAQQPPLGMPIPHGQALGCFSSSLSSVMVLQAQLSSREGFSQLRVFSLAGQRPSASLKPE